MTLVDGLAKLIGGEGDARGSVLGLNYEEGAGGNVFVGWLPANPNKVVSVYPSGGYDADAGLPYDAPTIQIITRSDSNPRWALEMWQLVYSALHGLRNVTLPDGTYLVSCLAIQSGPVHIGRDENGRFQYGMNLQCEIRNPTAERPT